MKPGRTAIERPMLLLRSSLDPAIAYVAGVDAAKFGWAIGEHSGQVSFRLAGGDAHPKTFETTIWISEPIQSVDGTTILSEIAFAVPSGAIDRQSELLTLTIRISGDDGP